eukprot:comp11432_c0_seq1/m.5843 comp11432_c0_seq1/g.5843  ORF comp11432_c0_seq1/g.5843 comp11432_c0_seq1/m.5843 type:complete len:299 (-) comp11432_c0_seq1:395-1291(-)
MSSSEHKDASLAGSEGRPEVTDESLRFLSEHTGVKDMDVLREHVYKIWEESKEKFHAYRCIQRLMFLRPRVNTLPFYPTFLDIVSRAKNEGSPFRILETGCCFGTDARRYLHDGVPCEAVTVTDLHSGYWELGLKLYMDGEGAEVTKLTQVWGDLASVDEGPRVLQENGLENTCLVVVNMLMLHVFSKEQSEVFLANVLKALKPGGTLFGTCVGSIESGLQDAMTPRKEAHRWRHNVESLATTLTSLGYEEVDVQEAPHHLRQGWAGGQQTKGDQEITWGPNAGEARMLLFVSKRPQV